MAERKITDRQLLELLIETGGCTSRGAAILLDMAPSGLHRRLALLESKGLVRSKKGRWVVTSAVLDYADEASGEATVSWRVTRAGDLLLST